MRSAVFDDKTNADTTAGTLLVNGVEEHVRVVQRYFAMPEPWRFAVDVPRAIIVMFIAGVGYLL